MSDFHASLDRALEHDPHTHWGVEGDALADLMAARDLTLRATPPALSPYGWWMTPVVDPSLFDACVLVTLPLCEHEIPAKGTE